MTYLQRVLLRFATTTPMPGLELLRRAGLADASGEPVGGAWRELRQMVASELLYRTGSTSHPKFMLTPAGETLRGVLPVTPLPPEDARMPTHEFWTQQHSGTAFDLLNPRPQLVHWEDIAIGLSRESRYAGQTVFPYSVAQHTILVCAILHEQRHETPMLRAGLLHDAAEAYLKDIPSPLKRLIPYYSDIEAAVCRVIFRRFDVEIKGGLPKAVKDADLLALRAEAWNLLSNSPLEGWAGPREAAELPGDYSRSILAIREDDVFWRAKLNELFVGFGLS